MIAPAGVHLPTTAALEPFSMRIESMAVAGHAYARDGSVPLLPEEGDAVPWSFLTLLRSQFRLGSSIHELMDRDASRGLMVSIDYEGVDGRPQVGDVIDARCELADQRVIERGRGTLVLTAVRTTWVARHRDWALTETTTMADLFGEHDAPRVRTPVIGGQDTDLGPIDRLRIAWCCVATEDLQAVHHDPQLARERGYDDVLVPGTLLAAIAERELRSRWPDGFVSLSARFIAPTYPDDHLVLRWSDPLNYEIHRTGDAPAVVAVGGGRLS